jgi:hypothetical protein
LIALACEADRPPPTPPPPAIRIVTPADAPAADAAPLPPRRCTIVSGPERRPVPEPAGTRAAVREVMPDRDCRAFESTEYADDEASVRAMPVGFDVLASANAYRKLFRCRAPASFDFTRERLAVYRFHHQTPESAMFSYAVEEQGRLKVVLETSFAYQGTAPMLHRGVLAFALPREPAAVELVACAQPQAPCSPRIR